MAALNSAGPRKPLLACFDSNRDFFALVSSDNRVKVWEVVSGKVQQGKRFFLPLDIPNCFICCVAEFVEANHLVAKYTAIAWSASVTGRQVQFVPYLFRSFLTAKTRIH